MINRALAIYNDNKSTFYDYRTNRPHGSALRNVTFLVLSAALALLMRRDSGDLLDAVITVQAILIGFSFSVMFFLVQSGNKTETNYQSLEEGLRQEQVALLSKELFWNISYFNLTAISGLIFALSLMVPNLWGATAAWAQNQVKLSSAIPWLMMLQMITFYLSKFLFCLLLIESSFTFLRTVSRVNFLFEERMKSVS